VKKPSALRAAMFAIASAVAFSTAAPAAFAANPAAETYVQTNATAALSALANRTASQEARAAEFRTLMQRFADVPRISNYVLGRYSAQLRQDPALMRDWQDAFMNYAVAVYQDQLDQFRGNSIKVTGSVDRVPDKDIIVTTDMLARGQTKPLPVKWRLLKSGETWRVMDVALVLEGNEVWLAQQQQRDFLAQLDKSKGDIRALITSVRALTKSMRARISARG
jgi:phospholipid transport system substrate-binding protein